MRDFMVVDGLPFISANACWCNETDALHLFQSKYPGDYTAIKKFMNHEKWPHYGYTIKFKNNADEIWFRLKHG